MSEKVKIMTLVHLITHPGLFLTQVPTDPAQGGGCTNSVQIQVALGSAQEIYKM